MKQILVVRSKSGLTTHQLAEVQNYYAKLLPEYRVVAVSGDLYLEVVSPSDVEIEVGSRVWPLNPKPLDEGKTGTVRGFKQGYAIVNWDGSDSCYFWKVDELLRAPDREPCHGANA
jgi:hypothetical protein